MGLSYDERYDGMVHAVNEMVKIGKKTPMSKLTGKLWHALIGCDHKSNFWLTGGCSSTDVKINGSSVWERAITHHTSDILSEDQADSDDVDNVLEDNLSIQKLLKYGKPSDVKVFNLYEWTEQAIYYLRRYNDEMLNSFSKLDKLISDIQGACFNYFKKDDIFAKAYIANKIFKHLYTGTYPYQEDKWDTLTKWLVDKGVHWNLDRCMEMDLKELAKIHVSIVGDDSIKNRVICLGRVLVRRLHKYSNYPIMKKYIPKTMWDKAKKMYEDHEKPTRKEQSELSLYGWSYYS
jgi:hypothetical protein